METKAVSAIRAHFFLRNAAWWWHDSRQVRDPLAVNTLKFMPKKGARIVLKVLGLRDCHAYNNFNADVDDLKVTRIEVDPAPIAQRFHSWRASKGRGVRIAKRNSHILVSSVRR